MTASAFSRPASKSSFASTCATTSKPGSSFAHAMIAFPIRPCAPLTRMRSGAMSLAAKLFDEVEIAESRQQLRLIGRSHFAKRQPELGRKPVREAERRLDRDRIGLEEQIPEQRVEARVNLARLRGAAIQRRLDHADHFPGNDIRGHGDNSFCTYRHE